MIQSGARIFLVLHLTKGANRFHSASCMNSRSLKGARGQAQSKTLRAVPGRSQSGEAFGLRLSSGAFHCKQALAHVRNLTSITMLRNNHANVIKLSPAAVTEAD
jgi:hypothetical protein